MSNVGYYRQLGRAGVRVSPFAVGTANFGMVTDEADAHRILDAARDAGINFVDTAYNYNAGDSEEIVGRWLAADPRRRDDVVLATKVYYPPNKYTSKDPVEQSGSWAWPNGRGLSARHIRHACEASLRRLRTDHIDLYQMHHVDRDVTTDEIWQAMETLVAQGKVVYVGTSNHAGWHLARACETARARQLLGPVSEQSLYNLLARTVELEVLPACEEYGVGFLAYSPLGAGALGGPPKERARRTFTRKHLGAEVLARIERFEKLCADLGHPPASVATAWLLERPTVTSIVLGPRTVEQLEGAIASLEVTLTDDVRSELDRLFPGPGGPAPEAYAL
jgi:aryl-alcohol dehydrogenase-like predicted oxidoreductase